MKNLIPLFCLFLLTATGAFSQATLPRIDIYGSQGLFLEQLNYSELIPEHQRNQARLGDDFSFGTTIKFPLTKGRWVIGAGVGYKQMHYSMSKYTIGDFISGLFLFDAGGNRVDTFPLSRVRFVSSYIEVPLSFAFHLPNRHNNLFGFSAGINIKPSFLLKSKPQFTFDEGQNIPVVTNDSRQKLYNAYSKDASKIIINIQPYLEWSMNFSKGFGMGVQLWPLSYYGSKLNDTFTSYTYGLISFSAAFIYDFNQ